LNELNLIGFKTKECKCPFSKQGDRARTTGAVSSTDELPGVRMPRASPDPWGEGTGDGHLVGLEADGRRAAPEGWAHHGVDQRRAALGEAKGARE